MKILIALHNLSFFGGVQTWSLTMCSALKNMGHEVSFFTCTAGISNGKIFDLILCNSNQALNDIKEFKGKKIFISHGILPPLEQPIKGADIYVAVSEEVAKNCETQGFPVQRIIRNPIDLDKFRFSGCNEKVKTIAFFDYSRRKFSFMDELEKHGFKMLKVGNPPIPEPEKIIESADLVMAKGRSAYEAMAMGKNVIVSGDNNGCSGIDFMDGFVDNKTFFEFRLNNFSGRHNQIPISSIDVLLKEIGKYDQKQGTSNRGLIYKHNNSKDIAKQFLELAN